MRSPFPARLIKENRSGEAPLWAFEPEKYGSSGNRVPADEKGPYLSAVNSPGGGF
jgi:hypothetical protein